MQAQRQKEALPERAITDLALPKGDFEGIFRDALANQSRFEAAPDQTPSAGTPRSADLEELYKLTRALKIPDAAMDDGISHYREKHERKERTAANREELKERIRARKRELGVESGGDVQEVLYRVKKEAEFRDKVDACKKHLKDRIDLAIEQGSSSIETEIRFHPCQCEFGYRRLSPLKIAFFPILLIGGALEVSTVSITKTDPFTIKSASIQELLSYGRELGLEPYFTKSIDNRHQLWFRLPEIN